MWEKDMKYYNYKIITVDENDEEVEVFLKTISSCSEEESLEALKRELLGESYQYILNEKY